MPSLFRRFAIGLLFTLVAAPAVADAQGMAQPAAAGLPRIESALIREESTQWQLSMARDTMVRNYATMSESVSFTTHAGEPAVLLVRTFPTPRGPIVDSALSVRATMAPIWQRSHQPTKTMRLDFGPDGVTGTVTPKDSATRDVRQELREPMFDGTSLSVVIAALPLRAGYEVVLPEYIFEKAAVEGDTIRVTGSDQVAGPDGARHDAWIVESLDADSKAEYAIDRQTRAILRHIAIPRKGDVRVIMTRLP